MTETLLQSAFLLAANSLFIWGLSFCFDEGMIFHGLHKWFIGWDRIEKVPGKSRERIPIWIQKPLYSCPICMASVWGSMGYTMGTYFLFGWSAQLLILWPIYCFALAGLNGIIYNLYPGCDE